MDLPEDKGTYVLIASLAQMKRLEIGSLGRQDIVPGFYLYVGSAFGAGGLRARIGHHLESTAIRTGISTICSPRPSQWRFGSRRPRPSSNMAGPTCWKTRRSSGFQSPGLVRQITTGVGRAICFI